jgi:MoaA/NifB/PqqE/SkfB family radical SAM enzyme
MLTYDDIRVLQIEISNHCNAACPQCPRNFYGGKTIPTLPLRRMSLDEFKSIFSENLLINLRQIYFCGTYGDPLTNSSLIDMARFIKDGAPHVEIGVHTNGGIGSVRMFAELAGVVDFIAFGIDGLQDTNHIYRRNVRWNKIMANCQAFIESGGKAIWDFIVFKHNQHQVEQARQLSKKLGFSHFSIKRTGRFLDRAHNYSDHLVVRTQQGTIDYVISPPSDQKYRNQHYEVVQFIQRSQTIDQYARTTNIKCNALRAKEVYIGADGFVFPCGWLHDRLYGPEAEMHEDHVMIKRLMTQAGGLKATNIYYNTLQNIVDGAWFDIIGQSWHNQNRLTRCGIMCGEQVNLIGTQNVDIIYKD